MLLRSLLTVLLVTPLVACSGEDTVVDTAATTADGAAASASDSSHTLGTDVDAETLADILQLDVEQNEANRVGDSEGMIDRMVADDTLWVGSTGGVATKAQVLAVVRHNFQRDPSRTKAGADPHDDFGTRRFGDAIVHHGRSTTINPDGSAGQARRYLVVLQKQRGQWWIIGRETIPIDYTPAPAPSEIVAVQAGATASPTSTILLGTEVAPEVEQEIVRLSDAQNQANGNGDGDNVIRDRLFADDVVWVSSAGHVQTKDDYLAAIRANFAADPNRAISPHDDYRVRRFGDTIIQLGRSNSVNADGSAGARRRYMNVFTNRDGEWWYVAHGATTIVSSDDQTP
jgi:ketosteroid isomerase-like protein